MKSILALSLIFAMAIPLVPGYPVARAEDDASGLRFGMLRFSRDLSPELQAAMTAGRGAGQSTDREEQLVIEALEDRLRGRGQAGTVIYEPRETIGYMALEGPVVTLDPDRSSTPEQTLRRFCDESRLSHAVVGHLKEGSPRGSLHFVLRLFDCRVGLGGGGEPDAGPTREIRDRMALEEVSPSGLANRLRAAASQLVASVTVVKTTGPSMAHLEIIPELQALEEPKQRPVPDSPPAPEPQPASPLESTPCAERRVSPVHVVGERAHGLTDFFEEKVIVVSAVAPCSDDRFVIEGFPVVERFEASEVEQTVARLNQRQYGGETDWRLPTPDELRVLIAETGANPDNLTLVGSFEVEGDVGRRNWLWTRNRDGQGGNRCDSKPFCAVRFTTDRKHGGLKMEFKDVRQPAWVIAVRTATE